MRLKYVPTINKTLCGANGVFSWMWAECRKQDKAVQSLLSKQRKRADRKRRDREKHAKSNPHANVSIIAQAANVTRPDSNSKQNTNDYLSVSWFSLVYSYILCIGYLGMLIRMF